MKDEQKENIKNKVLVFLDIRDDGNISETELLKLLKKKRKEVHPDSTTNYDVKKLYEDKIKEANELFEEFTKSLQKKSEINTLQLHNKNNTEIDFLDSQIEINKLENELKDYKDKVYLLKRTIELKEKEIKKLLDDKVKIETKKLKDLFRPKKNNNIILGISAILSALIFILSQTEKVIKFYTKYLPNLNSEVINYITLGILLIITIFYLKNYIGKLIVKKWTSKINTSKFISELFEYVKDNTIPYKGRRDLDFDFDLYQTKKFKEIIIYEYIEKSFKVKFATISFLYSVIGINNDEIFENFKNILIFKLINKDIINISGNSGFDKVFTYREE